MTLGEPVVFVGPSLDPSKARMILPGDYRGVVTRGDVDALSTGTLPNLIAIIDGAFFQRLSVSPKEILRVLRAGCIVLGSSSIGALRAVELAPFGMIGVGYVFEQFRDGILDSDDEVAMLVDPETLEAASVPLVNIRFALKRAVELGLLLPNERAWLLRIAQAMYFADRTYPALVASARRRLPRPRAHALAHFLEHEAPDVKQMDAIALLYEARAIIDSPDPIAAAVHRRMNSP